MAADDTNAVRVPPVCVPGQPGRNVRWDVFLSYASDDAPIAAELFSKLVKKKVSCFKAPEGIGTGEPWETEIRSALHESRLFVVILSESSINKRWVSIETAVAWGLNKTIMAGLLNVSAKQLEAPVSHRQARAIGDPASNDRFVKEVALKIKTLKAAEVQASPGRSVQGLWQGTATEENFETAPGASKPRKYKLGLELTQSGSLVTGTLLLDASDFDCRDASLSAEVDGFIIPNSSYLFMYYRLVAKESLQFGTTILLVNHRGDEMTGYFMARPSITGKDVNFGTLGFTLQSPRAPRTGKVKPAR
jgi:hypothetical protein